MKISFSNHFYAGIELNSERLETIASLGYENIEFWTMPPHIDLYNEKSNAHTFRLLEESGLKINSYHTPIFKIDTSGKRREIAYITDTDENERAESVKLICRSIEVISESGSKLAIVHGDIKDKSDIEGAKSALKKSLTEICGYALKKETRIALENTEREMPVSDLVEIVKDSGLLNLGICVDAGHANIFEDAVKAVEIAGKYLLNIHMSDNDGIGDLHLHPGEGNVRWNEIGDILNKMNYRGSITLEVKSCNGADGITFDEVEKMLFG